MTAIATHGLTKRYGEQAAVDGLDLHVASGEIYGFLGLNGAGKTTTIRMLLGMARPTRGEARIFGEVVGPGSHSVWRRVGHLVERAVAYPELSVRENLEIARRFYRVPDAGATARAIEQLGLGANADRTARTLSLGNLQRLGLAKALIHRPALILLDEPANGLDPAGVVEVRQLLAALVREHGATLFISSHILSEVERLATRIGIIHQGRLIEELNAAEMERRRRRRLVVSARDLPAARVALEAAGFRAADCTEGFEIEDTRAIERPDDIARLLVEAGAPPTLLAVRQDDLETHFLRLTESAT